MIILGPTVRNSDHDLYTLQELCVRLCIQLSVENYQCISPLKGTFLEFIF